MTDPIDAYAVGARAELEVEITDEFIRRFADFSGDVNPLHMDGDFARTTPFKRRVAHGMSYGALFSNLVGMKIPGEGALWIAQSFRFVRPVFIGDRLALSVEVAAISRSARTLTLTCAAVNQHGEQVTAGEGEVLVPESADEPVLKAVRERRVALVAGASRGIGAAVARRLNEAGFAVAITCRSSLEDAEALCRTFDRGLAIVADGADPDAMDAAAETVRRKFGPIDTLVLNAGGDGLYGKAGDPDFALMRAQLDVQLAGPHALVSACLPSMIERAFGCLVAIGSTYALGAPPVGMAPYVVAKAALAAFVRCLAVDYGPHGVRANLVVPGMTDTALLSRVPDRAKKVAVMQNPLRRLATPDDVAGAVAYLASDAAAYVNGHSLVVSGGASIS